MKHAPRGFALLESIAAAAILAVLLSIVLALFAAMSAARREIDRRLVATAEAANWIERVAAMPYAEVTPEQMAALALSPQATESLAGGVLRVGVTQREDLPPTKEVQVEVNWPSGTAGGTSRVALYTFVFASEGGDP